MRKKEKWGQWGRESWLCQSSGWQKTSRQTMAGMLNGRLKVSILHCAHSSEWMLWMWLMRGWAWSLFRPALWEFGLFTPVDKVQYSQINRMIFTSSLNTRLARQHSLTNEIHSYIYHSSSVCGICWLAQVRAFAHGGENWICVVTSQVLRYKQSWCLQTLCDIVRLGKPCSDWHICFISTAWYVVVLVLREAN